MKLAFNGLGHYAEFSDGYALYVRRAQSEPVDESTYKRIVKAYCKRLADRLYDEGLVDLPKGMGSIAATVITRKPQYRGKRFVGYGKYDWTIGGYDGKLKTFGLVFLPKHTKKNMRCFGYVANRELFKRVKQHSDEETCKWKPLDFNDDMI